MSVVHLLCSQSPCYCLVNVGPAAGPLNGETKVKGPLTAVDFSLDWLECMIAEVLLHSE